MAKKDSFVAQLTGDRILALTLIVAALGYFVDVFDLLLFSIVRVQSLKDIGVPVDEAVGKGIFLLNVQMAGLMLGGLLWGVLGDKYGRISVLFGSILLYSIANIANAFVHSVETYAIARFITGLGLAGELGIGVTLASELLPKSIRGLGTTLISTIGVMGATFASVLSHYATWQTSYIVGGVMGLLLLVLRIRLRESGMYKDVAGKSAKASRGNLKKFFGNPVLLKRYLCIILIGAPIWAINSLYITFTDVFAKAFKLGIEPTPATAVLACYVGTTFGSFFSGYLSQRLQSRRKSIAVSLSIMMVAGIIFNIYRSETLIAYYSICGMIGFGLGYWTMFVQLGAEQFGTNIRATAATSVPNVVRGFTIPVTASFNALKGTALGVPGGAAVVLSVVFACAFAGLWSIKETFNADLDYVEAH